MTGATRRSDASEESGAADVARLLGDRTLTVVSNREPYIHGREDGEVTVEEPAGGLTAALDPVVRATGGTWIAWGSGDADFEVAEDGCVEVPPSDPAYTLRRVDLADEQVDGYYYGYSNQMLWPLCHCDLAKLSTDADYWRRYREVNERFAAEVCDHAGRDEVVWFQDYHLALAPRVVRDRRRTPPSLLHFWHIPWPSPDVFRASPQHRDLLEGLLGNDLVGFHTDGYCRNFLDCAAALLPASVDRDTGSVVHRGHRTYVRSFPLGIDAAAMSSLAEAGDDTDVYARAFDVDPDTSVAIGVDRLDYTKGITHRLDALEHLFEHHPEYRGELTYVQKASESRSSISAYERLQDRVAERVARIDRRFGTDDWRPVIQVTDVVPRETLANLYRQADLALVTPLRDGMNLVAKEYIAAQVDEDGVLVLSELAGASEQLGDDAVLVHPYDVPGMADAVREALSFSAAERRRRMRGLRRTVSGSTVYDWMRWQLRTLRAVRRGRSAETSASAR